MDHPILVLKDPIEFDYSKIVEKVIKKLTRGSPGLDILIERGIETTYELNNVLSVYYQTARKAAIGAGFGYGFDINVLFNIQDISKLGWNVLYKSDSETFEAISAKKVVLVEGGSTKAVLADKKADKDSTHFISEFPTTAVGGTFDHLHDGHKILLSMASFLTKRKLIIGITGPKLLEKKKFAEVLESFEQRQSKVISFIQIISRKEITYEIYKINDVCGPTGYLKDIQALIVSRESFSGGEYVNNYRSEHDLPKLDVIVINVIGKDKIEDDKDFDGKLSSTAIREEEYKRIYGKEKGGAI
ncbi:uncharacterized protein PRCAT00004886001 [Priceomyces carsonii]|uniref:uncharacterized protein n=1 Tax=Priceomyces carsonii TaxID=28549 RepID=UPI002ED86D3D|nr:unnamed protein product [Priceomyces carsonii]